MRPEFPSLCLIDGGEFRQLTRHRIGEIGGIEPPLALQRIRQLRELAAQAMEFLHEEAR